MMDYECNPNPQCDTPSSPAVVPTMRRPSSILLLLGFLAFASVPRAHAIEAKCSACRAVAKELSKKLSQDSESASQKVVDMRGRLDSTGKRYGKRISYKVSELRFIEILEGVCDDDDGSVKALQLDETRGIWRVPKRNSGEKILGARAKVMRADITGYCARLIEETEDALQSAVYEDKVDSGNVEEFLCRSASPECDDSVDFDEEDGDSVKEEDVAVEPKKQKKKRKTKSSSNKKKKEL